MEFTKILNSRKSIRTFTGEAVPDEALIKILNAANAAPIGSGKYESVHLTVVRSKELLTKIEENTEHIFDVHGRSFLYNAPELVIVSTTGNDNVSNSNAAIVVHNMVMEAVECEVGACYIWGCMMALAHNNELIKELNIPEGFTPSCAVALGISNEAYSIRKIPENRISINYI